jgi:hypothetical protein
MIKVRLPVSGLEVTLRQPRGSEDVLLAEATRCDTHLALALLGKIAHLANDAVMQWELLSVTDLDGLLLRVRQMVFGDRVRADTICPAPGCGSKVEIVFLIEEYMDYYKPNLTPDVELTSESGWFQLKTEPIAFRLPTAADQIAIALQPNPVQELLRRCIRPFDLSPPLLQQVEEAMEAIAPSLCNPLQGVCPECRASVEVYFDPQQFSLQELRQQAVAIYEEVHLLATQYQWTEAAILKLPRDRRRQYAERIRQERRLA